MCGRFTLNKTAEALASAFDVQEVPELEAQYNVAPTQMVGSVLYDQDRQREFKQLRWGLIPSWAKDPSMGAKLINARAETVAEKPAFRSAFKHRRCLVVADGFYEWQQQKAQKQPFYFRLKNEELFAFAGLWEAWKSPQGEKITSCTILTTTANELVESVHHRMPVILQPQDYDLWLDPQSQSLEVVQELLHPYAATAMITYPVSTLVNNSRHNSSQCIMPIGGSEE